jgi:hypothetical protein
MNDADCLSATRYSRSTRLTIPTFLAVKGASTRGYDPNSEYNNWRSQSILSGSSEEGLYR